jgi:hypothetical protein
MSNLRQDDQESTPKSVTNVAEGRRKLLKLGVGTTPVLMALASRSAFACHSTKASVFCSVNNSRPDVLQSSNGCSPGYWKTHTGTSNWPSPCYSHSTRVGSKNVSATTFKSIFGASGAPSPFSNSTTMLEVLESGGGGSKAVARACVAAYLNARSNKTPSTILSVDDVVNEIWYQYATRGYYEPTAGVKWFADSPNLPVVQGANTGGKGGIIGYLNTTWT